MKTDSQALARALIVKIAKASRKPETLRDARRFRELRKLFNLKKTN